MSYGIIYALTSPSGRIYVGQTIQGLDKRWRQHGWSAKRGVDTALCRALRKYDPKLWAHEVVAECDSREELDLVERLAVHMFGDYNCQPGGVGAERPRGQRRTTEQRARMSAAQKGKTINSEGRARMSDEQRGRKQSAEMVARRVAKTTGQKRTPEQCAQIRAGKLANPISDEGRRAVSDAQKGRPTTDETKAKISAARKGKPWTAARRAAQERRKTNF